MTTYVTKWSDAGGSGNTINADAAGDLIRNVYEIDLSIAPFKGVTFGVGDIIDMGAIPANHRVADMVVVSDQLDTNGTPLLAFDVGVLTGTVGDTVNARTMGTEFFAASTLARAGGTARLALTTGFLVSPTYKDQSIGVKVTAAAATLATTGKLRLMVSMTG